VVGEVGLPPPHDFNGLALSHRQVRPSESLRNPGALSHLIPFAHVGKLRQIVELQPHRILLGRPRGGPYMRWRSRPASAAAISPPCAGRRGEGHDGTPLWIPSQSHSHSCLPPHFKLFRAIIISGRAKRDWPPVESVSMHEHTSREPTPAAQRMRHYRRRRRNGMRVVLVALNAREIDRLVERGYLVPSQTTDRKQIQSAAKRLISDVLLGPEPPIPPPRKPCAVTHNERSPTREPLSLGRCK
jgi:hypothetical protein